MKFIKIKYLNSVKIIQNQYKILSNQIPKTQYEWKLTGVPSTPTGPGVPSNPGSPLKPCFPSGPTGPIGPGVP